MPGNLSGEGAVLLAAAASVQFAQGRSESDLAFWAAFFTILGDNLALLALSAPSDSE